MIIITKSHPAQQAMTAAARPANLVDGDTRRNPGEPSPEQAEAGTYKKPRIQWRGLTIAIENPAGSVRRGTNRHGVSWEIRMRFDYGEVVGSMGVDGDPVDIYLGPALEDAPMVYVVHQRKVGDWESYDEDKAMAGFLTEEDARQAFLSNYNDPRFLGPITAMPVDEFVAKVRATKDKPAMIKAILFFKSHVGAYLRGGKLVNLRGYQGRSAHAVAGPGQMSLFGGPMSGKPLPPSPLDGKDAVAHTPDLFDGKKPAERHLDTRVGPDANLHDGTIIRDTKGKQYRVHYMRHSTIVAHPIVDGKPQVSADTTVRFWTHPERTPAGDNDRTDAVFVVKSPLAS